MPNASDRTSPPTTDGESEPFAGLGNLLTFALMALAVRALLQLQLQWAGQRGFLHPTLAWSLVLLAATTPFGILICRLSGRFRP